MAMAASGTQINLSWTPPSNTGGQDITGYKIEGSQLGNCTGGAPVDVAWTTLAASNSGTTYAHMGLMAGQNWIYQVSSITDTGTSTAASTCAMATTMDKPDAPTALMADADGPSRIDLSWTAPQAGAPAADDPSVTGYKIEYSMTGAAGWMDLKADTGSADTMYTDVGLLAGTERFYRVSAINATGTSGPSNIDSDKTDDTAVAPGAPTGVTATSGTDGTSVMVTWMAPYNHGGSAITGYKVMYRMTGSSDDYMEMDAAADATSATVTGLTAGESYDIAVVATNAVGDSEMSDVIMVTVEAASMELRPPSGVMVEVDDSDPGEASVTITWTDGPNADRHVVFLFDENFEVTPDRIAGNQTDGETTFDNVPSGTYTAVVVAVEDSPSGTFVLKVEIGVATVTVN
jgi:titin